MPWSAQIPALLISVAAAMVVSRVGKEQDVGSQIAKQVFSSPRSLGITAGVIGALGVIPGMPNLVFLTIAGGLAYAAWWMRERDRRAAAARHRLWHPWPSPMPRRAGTT